MLSYAHAPTAFEQARARILTLAITPLQTLWDITTKEPPSLEFESGVRPIFRWFCDVAYASAVQRAVTRAVLGGIDGANADGGQAAK